MATTCGHLRCEGQACRVHLAPPSEVLAPGAVRVAVHSAYRDMMLYAMQCDPEWTLRLAAIARLDGTR